MNFFTLPVPPPLNQTYRYGDGNYYKTKKARDWEEEAGYNILVQFKDKTIATHCAVTIYAYYKRETDIDASIKIIMDLLEKQRVIKNDKLIVKLIVNKYISLLNPRVEVIIDGEIERETT